MNILIVDDDRLNLEMIGAFCRAQGFNVVTAMNGLEAIEKFSSNPTDLVLMDVIMPGMDGYKTTEKIKEMSGSHWVPVILITAQEKSYQNLIDGISCGAEDYLYKPVNLMLLKEKIKVMQKIAVMQSTLQDKIKELEKRDAGSKEELVLARQTMERLNLKVRVDKKRMQQWVLPAKVFSADIVAAAMTPADNLHVILADGTGHGLAAALGVMPVTETFYAMTAGGFPISNIVYELNQKIKRLTPVERFVAATLISIDWVEKTIEVWNGGFPPTLFVVEDGRVQHRWKSKNLPLGILNSDKIDTKTEIYKWDTSGQLFVFSDGLVDARDETENMFGLKRAQKIISETVPSNRFEQLKTDLIQHLGKGMNEDDISLVTIQCPIELDKLSREKPEISRPYNRSARHWKLDLFFDSKEIKGGNILPMLLTWLKQTGISEWDCQRLFQILSELYYNALDHGLLNSASCLKSSTQGFERYLNKRSECLSNLEDGKIEIYIERSQKQGEDLISLRIKDSGRGFDYSEVLENAGERGKKLSVRGIGLVHSLSKEMTYLNGGNEVQVVYSLC